MQMPALLQAEIEKMLEGMPAQAVRAAAQSLSRRYRQGEKNPDGANLLRSETEIAAYAAFRMPATYAALVTDEPADTEIPRFALDDIAGLAEFVMQNLKEFTHFNAEGRARMVDVGEKDVTRRTAVAAGRVLVSPETLALIRCGGMKKEGAGAPSFGRYAFARSIRMISTS